MRVLPSKFYGRFCRNLCVTPDLSRISGFISASLLLVFFLGQFAKLHRSLARALHHIRRQTERALSESQERMHALCDTALDGIITMDHAGQIADFNLARSRYSAIAYSQRTRTQLCGRSYAPVLFQSPACIWGTLYLLYPL